MDDLKTLSFQSKTKLKFRLGQGRPIGVVRHFAAFFFCFIEFILYSLCALLDIDHASHYFYPNSAKLPTLFMSLYLIVTFDAYFAVMEF